MASWGLSGRPGVLPAAFPPWPMGRQLRGVCLSERISFCLSLLGASNACCHQPSFQRLPGEGLCSAPGAQSQLRPRNTGGPCSLGTPWDPAHTCHLRLLRTSRLREGRGRTRNSKGVRMSPGNAMAGHRKCRPRHLAHGYQENREARIRTWSRGA